MKKVYAGVLLGMTMAFGATAQADEEVTFYAANSEDAVQTVLDVARELEPELKINVVKASTGTLLQRIRAESQAPQADVFWSSGFGTLADYTELMQPVQASADLPVPEALNGPEQLWAGSNVHVVVLMANASQLEGDTPKGWEDLLSGRYRGRIAFGDPTASSSAYLQLFGIYKKYGEEGVRKLAENVVVTGGSSSVYRGVASAEYPLGITIEYAAYRYVAGGQQDIELIYPQEGTFLSPEGLFMVKGAPHPEAADKLYAVLTSAEFQQAILESSYRRPVRSDIDLKSVSSLPNLDQIEVFELDQKEAGEQREQLIEMWKNALSSAQ